MVYGFFLTIESLKVINAHTTVLVPNLEGVDSRLDQNNSNEDYLNAQITLVYLLGWAFPLAEEGNPKCITFLLLVPNVWTIGVTLITPVKYFQD